MSLQQTISDILVCPTTSLLSLKHQLEAALHDVADAEKRGKLEARTRILASVVGDYANSLCMSLTQMHLSGQALVTSVSTSKGKSGRTKASHAVHNTEDNPSYVEPAYHWILQHLYNPYPTAEYRDRLAKKTHCRRKDIDHWFKVTRQKIGWTMIREAFFKTRKEMIQSASCYFVQPNPEKPLESKIIKEFELMRVKAEELYDFKPTQLAFQIDATVRSPASHSVDRGEGPSVDAVKHTQPTVVTPQRYLSSSSSSPEPEDNACGHRSQQCSQLIGKRRVREEEDSSPSSCKRHRPIKPLPATQRSPINLPTWTLSDATDLQTSSLPCPHASNPRKRRVSETDTQQPFKRRIIGASSGPILRSVSDPSTSSHPASHLNAMTNRFTPISTDIVEASMPLEPSADVSLLSLSRFNQPADSPDLDSVRPSNISNADWKLFMLDFNSNDDWAGALCHPRPDDIGDDTSSIGSTELDAVTPQYGEILECSYSKLPVEARSLLANNIAYPSGFPAAH